ncbi:MAG: putative N-acetylmannosamine-6-phosphate 2-epimerase [Bifidobacteriaceae bacterium]|jgi:N-acylglucosamine-6-phosphate 2-epimerase|nr:putative N-acetylmannosamine-6-phosphate 2-epimerase [Bifidobacteriaceae bacterium]
MVKVAGPGPGLEGGRRRAMIGRLLGGLVVSSQAHRSGGPLDAPDVLVRMALAAADGGAAGFRVASAEVVARLRPVTDLPIIGLIKRHVPGYEVYITPSAGEVAALITAGADIVAADAAATSRPAEPFAELAELCHQRDVAIMADCATTEQALVAAAQGADIVATTLAGHTSQTRGVVLPDLRMLAELKSLVNVPVAAEGGVWGPDHVAAAFAAGADFIVVGSAVTDPERITRRLLRAIPTREGLREEKV